MFDLEQLKRLLNDVRALPNGWHPEPESIFRVLQSNSGGQNLLTIKDAAGVVVCVIPNNHLVDCQMELASSIAIWRAVMPLLILDTIARDIRLNEIRETLKQMREVGAEHKEASPTKAFAEKFIDLIELSLDREIEEKEIEKEEPEKPGGIKPA